MVTGRVSSQEAQARQRRQDDLYLAACEEAGIKPELPSYRSGGDCYSMSAAVEVILHKNQTALDGGGSSSFDHDDIDARLGWKEPDAEDDCDVSIELHPDAERVLDWVLDIAIPDKRRFCQRAISGRLIALCWLLEKGEIGRMSQTSIADRLEMTRSNFSQSVRQIQKEIGGNLRARGQKSEIANKKYRAIRNKAVSEGRGNLRKRRADNPETTG